MADFSNWMLVIVGENAEQVAYNAYLDGVVDVREGVLAVDGRAASVNTKALRTMREQMRAFFMIRRLRTWPLVSRPGRRYRS